MRNTDDRADKRARRQATLSDADIRSYAKAFTKGILGGAESDMRCYMVSWPLAGYLSAIGIECEAVEGEVADCHHYWVEFPDGRIIDATADQFGLCNVWLQPRPNHYKRDLSLVGNQSATVSRENKKPN